ncbi:hypothetical protein Anapl_16856 [Anas platyrhynchos]|uniref:Uncharacterized protein n=1 Tax=Anas platyrhynchos TaxID=8839 RepID=R0KXR6_ANAPL|nr:hypothetical protein Anapl_16856 [Anas platyrhynchos]
MEEYEPGMTAETLEAGTRGTGGQAWKEKADAQGLMPDDYMGCFNFSHREDANWTRGNPHAHLTTMSNYGELGSMSGFLWSGALSQQRCFLPGFQRRKFSITSHLISQHLVPQKPNTLHTESAMDLLCKQTQMRHSAWEIFVLAKNLLSNCYAAPDLSGTPKHPEFSKSVVWQGRSLTKMTPTAREGRSSSSAPDQGSFHSHQPFYKTTCGPDKSMSRTAAPITSLCNFLVASTQRLLAAWFETEYQRDENQEESKQTLPKSIVHVVSACPQHDNGSGNGVMLSDGSRKNYAVKQRYINRASSGRLHKGQLSCKKYKGKSIFSNKTKEGLALQEEAQMEELADKDFITVLLISWQVSATQTWDSPLQTPAEPLEDWVKSCFPKEVKHPLGSCFVFTFSGQAQKKYAPGQACQQQSQNREQNRERAILHSDLVIELTARTTKCISTNTLPMSSPGLESQVILTLYYRGSTSIDKSPELSKRKGQGHYDARHRLQLYLQKCYHQTTAASATQSSSNNNPRYFSCCEEIYAEIPKLKLQPCQGLLILLYSNQEPNTFYDDRLQIKGLAGPSNVPGASLQNAAEHRSDLLLDFMREKCNQKPSTPCKGGGPRLAHLPCLSAHLWLLIPGRRHADSAR